MVRFCHPSQSLFGEAVFQRYDGVIFHPLGIEFHHVIGALGRFIRLLENVLAILIELAGCGIEGDGDLFSGFISRLLNGFEDDFDGFNVRLDRRGEASFIANGGVVTTFLKDSLEGVENFHAPA